MRDIPQSLIPFATVPLSHAVHRFYLGDCLDVLRALGPASVDVIVTSPPYNLGIRYRSYEDTLPREEYLAWTGAWIGEVARVLHPLGSLFLNVGAKPSDPWTPFDVAQVARQHLQLQNTIHWIKSITIERGSEGEISAGHYKPINSDRFLNDCHEFVFHFSPRACTPLDRLAIGVRYQDKSNIARWRGASGGRHCRGNTWFIPYETIQSRDRERPHPATFPPKLPEYCVKLHGRDRVTLVLDPFLGLGSTAVACARLGVNFVGVEMDEGYLQEAITRVRDATAPTLFSPDA